MNHSMGKPLKTVTVLFAILCTATCMAQGLAAAPAQNSTPQADHPRPFVIQEDIDALSFNFGGPDLDLYAQSEAFDAYAEQHGLLFHNKETEDYLTSVMARLLPKEAIDRVKWRVVILRDPSANIFSMPNGTLYIHTGLLSRLENEDQLAAVIAHEISHVECRDNYLANRDARLKMGAVRAATMASFVPAGIGASVLLGLAPVVLMNSIQGYQGDLEMQADQNSMAILEHAGYDPHGLLGALKVLQKAPASGMVFFWSDKLRVKQRFPEVEKHLATLPTLTARYGPSQSTFEATTRAVVEEDARLDIAVGMPQSAVSSGLKLLDSDPKNPEFLALCADGYRMLGGRPPVADATPEHDLQSKELRKSQATMTKEEIESSLLATPEGQQHWKDNSAMAERLYREALAIDPKQSAALRGLGLLYEATGRKQEAASELREYLTEVPNAEDARQIQHRIDRLGNNTLDSKTSGGATAVTTIQHVMMMPVEAQITRSTALGYQQQIQDFAAAESSISHVATDVLRKMGYEVDDHSLSPGVLHADARLQSINDDLQKQFDELEVQLKKKPKDVNKGRFTLGDGVTKLPTSTHPDALLFVRARSIDFTGAAKTFNAMSFRLSADKAEFEVALVDAANGEVLYYSRPVVRANLDNDKDTRKGIEKAFEKLAELKQPPASKP